ncbi:hypothetical protein [Salisediminibacterium selenitireducens]|uniref:Uncharacterized protein n=1 Tax=Bacillus selenitireducens (strain ATCC 700615 / DSM 15326 / MLS10) TaxID=439292 RepID=D6XTF2_BACIE|nr:hypothetical protein [Salisediminibacterium selenitireducens]ADH99088.1 hypothetical protein Bsel_1578 [[Bacillus] selenitireducens MLS10]
MKGTSAFKRLLFWGGLIIIAGGGVTAVFLALNFYLVPPEIDPQTGEELYEGMLHPQRAWIAVAVFMGTFITGLFLIGMSKILALLSDILDQLSK